ncbi:S16 family serine protease [Solidesulfovibrio sp.]|uniref:S16 family serine protease n=1 Tax=Solidesulfovibrio sp. TaxID=2910990 RepID=UPI002B1F00A6|nr:S16 family serine protease [Solidesulfovibrio sp.]MEA5088942.1 S16 family serine protease [Solidesulfovibrio sp.]
MLPVAGLREKCLAAKRAGIATVVVPKANADVVAGLPADVLEGLHVVEAGVVVEAAGVALRGREE